MASDRKGIGRLAESKRMGRAAVDAIRRRLDDSGSMFNLYGILAGNEAQAGHFETARRWLDAQVQLLPQVKDPASAQTGVTWGQGRIRLSEGDAAGALPRAPARSPGSTRPCRCPAS
jgi:hypothetical protein